MSKKFDLLVFIGRFQPFHNGHAEVLKRAFNASEHVLVVLGSASRPRSIENTWTVSERQVMISAGYPVEVARGQLLFGSVTDRIYNDQQWAADVQAVVDNALEHMNLTTEQLGRAPVVGLIGHDKDETSFYLRLFPQWERVEVPNVSNLSASQIRGYLLEEPALSDGRKMLIQSAVPAPVMSFIEAFAGTEHFEKLTSEYDFIRTYKKQFAAMPYPPIFQTTDAVVIQAGHVLLVKRKAQPGAGLWALPGGFLQPDETLLDGCIRELKEETRLKVPVPVLKGSLKGNKRFDHPKRSLRGRTITDAFLFQLEAQPDGLSPVKGADDAEKAQWVPLAQALEMSEQFFEDHIDILRYFIGQV